MRPTWLVLLVFLAGCTSPADPPAAGEGVPTDTTDTTDTTTTDGAPAGPVLISFGVDIAPYDPATGLAGDILFTEDLLFDDGRVHNDRPFVEFGWTHPYYGDMGNLEYWFYVPLHTTLVAPVGGTVSVAPLEHTGDWVVHFDSGSGVIVSFEHVVDVLVTDGERVEAGDPVADAGPRDTFGGELAMVELAVWQGGTHIEKHCPWDYLALDLQPVYQERFSRLAQDWEAFLGQDVYDEDAWVAPGCLVHDILET